MAHHEQGINPPNMTKLFIKTLASLTIKLSPPSSSYLPLILYFSLNYIHPHCSYLRLCKEWFNARPAATAAVTLSPIALHLRLHFN